VQRDGTKQAPKMESSFQASLVLAFFLFLGTIWMNAPQTERDHYAGEH
jgi:hypothetical protein